MRPLVEYVENAKESLVRNTDWIDWKFVGKVTLVIVPVVVWTVYWAALEFVYNLSKWINVKGGDLVEKFMENGK
jgi:small neutral amino acid transporter SnatA (MarC family)